MSERTLRDEIIAEMMKLIQPESVEMKPKPTIDELERILQSDDARQVDVRPDGSVWARERKTVTVGIVADAILRAIEERRASSPPAGNPAGADPEVWRPINPSPVDGGRG